MRSTQCCCSIRYRGKTTTGVVVFVLILLVAIALIITRVPTRTAPPPAPSPPTPSAPIVTPTPEQVSAEDVRSNNEGVGRMGRYEYDQARAIFADLVARHPDWHEARVNLAIATLNRQQAGDEEEAIAILRDVLSDDPTHLRAQYVKGILLLYRGEQEPALNLLSRVAQRDPNDAFAAYFIGQIHAAQSEHEDAVRWFARAIALDPYMRSAYFGKSRALFALGREQEADEQFAVFERLEPNPRAHTVEFVYTRMGPKANAIAVDIALEPAALPEGPVFLDPVPLLIDGDRVSWRVPRGHRPVAISVADISGNGLLDVFIPGVFDEDGLYNAVCMNIGERGYVLDTDHVLARIPNVNSALWGDINNDGLLDVYLCRRGPNVLVQQIRPNIWKDVTESSGTAGGNYDTVTGLLFDADHDGDLDIFLVNADGPNELLNNNRDTRGTFASIARQQGITGDGRASRQVIAADLESDRDLDIIVINIEPPHEVYLNDRLWQYRRQGPGTPYERLIAADIVAAVPGDLDVDGRVELYTLDSQGDLYQWRFNERKMLVPLLFDGADAESPEQQPPQLLAIEDFNGNARQEIIASRGGTWVAMTASGDEPLARGNDDMSLSGWMPMLFDVSQGPAIVGMQSNGKPPVIWRPGPGRHQFAALTFTGKDDPGHALRSNASGIGTHFAARMGTEWIAGSTLPNHSGPGQSHQPVAIGLAGHQQIDFVSIDWSDGVFQSEINLAAGELHTISETQRQLASCPVLFVWNGEKYEFASDVLGVGGIGFAVGPGKYAEPRPWEVYLLPKGLAQPKDGRYIMKIGEPMEESLYLDTASLSAYDLPPGWSMTIDERMGISDPQPTGDAIFFRRVMLPTRAFNDRGEDLTEILREQDYRAAPPGQLDLRFIGRLAEEHILTIEFDGAIDVGPLGLEAPEPNPYLVADGWIEYPYSQTMFAAWQAGADYRAPTLESRDPVTGEWQSVLEEFGYPAGFARQMAVPIPIDALPRGARELRLRTNQEIYWDRLKIVYAEQPPADLVLHDLELVRAEVKRTGFAQRRLYEQRRAYYDYDNRLPLWDTRHQSGFYTRLGDVLELVKERNDALAIIGPGEEIHMEFKAAAQTQATDPSTGLRSIVDGWTRRFVIEMHGWCKDMDLYTRDGETIEPVPSGGVNMGVREELHQRYNTRYRSGR